MKNINIDKTIIIKYVTYDYENGDSEVFDSKLLIVSSYEDLSDQIKSYYASCLDSEFFTMVSENDSKYIHHADTNQPIESYLLAYKNLSEAENDDEFNSNGVPFAFNHVFMPPETLNLGGDWNTLKEKLEFDTDEQILKKWGLDKIVLNTPQELIDAGYDDFLKILLEVYKNLVHN
mgnify:CR=1 FL=1|jgi:hypothetical protein|tara:strand:+ start:129 stop:656 length:528 start_codon:yes stop_codon:yes gene_type:complete